MSIVIVEPYPFSGVHVEVNAAIAATARAAFPTEPVLFFADARHAPLVRARLDRARAAGLPSCEGIEVVSARRETPIGWMPWREVPHLGAGLALALRRGALRLLVCHASIFVQTGLAAWLALRPEGRAAAIGHSGIAGPDRGSGLGPRAQLGRLARAFRRAYWGSRLPRAPRLVVLGEGIAGRLRSRNPYAAHRVDWIEHPLLFDLPLAPVPAPAQAPAGGPLRVGAVGVARDEKGTRTFARLATALFEAGLASSVRLSWVGKSHIGSRAVLAPLVRRGWIDEAPSPRLLEREEYERRIAALDCIVLPHEPAEYDIRASGAFLDALALGKPVVALRGSYFADQLRRFPGVGVLCDGERDLVPALARVAALASSGSWDRGRAALLEARAAFTPERNAPLLRAALS